MKDHEIREMISNLVEIAQKHGQTESIRDRLHRGLTPILVAYRDLARFAQKLSKYHYVLSYNESYFGEPTGMLKQVVAEIDRILPDEKIPFPLKGKEGCDCGCQEPTFTDPLEALRFLSTRFKHGGVAEAVAWDYAKDIDAILEKLDSTEKEEPETPAPNEFYATCPVCACPHWEGSGCRTADGHSAWQDTDGTWYNGPAEESQVRGCAHCGWKQTKVSRRGKVMGVTYDPIPEKNLDIDLEASD